jgi:hypothetical protein
MTDSKTRVLALGTVLLRGVIHLAATCDDPRELKTTDPRVALLAGMFMVSPDSVIEKVRATTECL